ncbi:hypothetical protein [Domibacillus robiginosus]|nr:hypothetical protein [Domibacillus robiginosus]
MSNYIHSLVQKRLFREQLPGLRGAFPTSLLEKVKKPAGMLPPMG